MSKMSDIVAGPWGQTYVGGAGTHWNWKASGPITRIDLVAQEIPCSPQTNAILCMAFKSTNNCSPTYGKSCFPEHGTRSSFDISGPAEYLIGISGAYHEVDYGSGSGPSVKSIKWLSFETNWGRVFRPWPQSSYEGGVKFSYKVPNGSHIIGFHGLYGCEPFGTAPAINNIGVFVRPITLPWGHFSSK